MRRGDRRYYSAVEMVGLRNAVRPLRPEAWLRPAGHCWKRPSDERWFVDGVEAVWFSSYHGRGFVEFETQEAIVRVGLEAYRKARSAFHASRARAVIKNAKRCWKFYTGKGVGSCSELAVYGTVDSKSRITQPVAQITVFDVREIIPLAATATVNPTEAV
jgi:hypothetical protein